VNRHILISCLFTVSDVFILLLIAEFRGRH